MLIIASPLRVGPCGRMFALVAAAWIASTGAASFAQDAPKLNFYPSLQVKFEAGESKNYFVARTGVVNMSGSQMSDIVIRQTFPRRFHPAPLGANQYDMGSRPEGYENSIEGEIATVRIPELRIAEATALVVRLPYDGRPGEVTFPGVEVEYTLDGQTYSERGPDQTWDLSKYTKYSGTLREFIKRYGGLELDIPDGSDWGFTDLAARLTGRVPTGPVEIESTSSGRMYFTIQAGSPGNLRQLTVMRRPYNAARELKAPDEVRRFIMGTVGTLADFTLDVDEMTVRQGTVGKYQAWIADTRWYDRIKDRYGEGPSRWYLFSDPKGGSSWIFHLSAQGRGEGPGKADTPNDAQEKALMSELTGIVESLRIL